LSGLKIWLIRGTNFALQVREGLQSEIAPIRHKKIHVRESPKKADFINSDFDIVAGLDIYLYIPQVWFSIVFKRKEFFH